MSTPPLQVVLQQPALPKYRIAVFRELARRPGIRLSLYYGSVASNLANVPSDDFENHAVPMHRIHLPGGRLLLWHSPQWHHAARSKADVLILSWNLHYATLVPALLRAKINGVPTILWGHGYSKNEVGWRKYLREKVAKLATALLFYNHTAAQKYLDNGWDPKRIYTALNSLDQNPIQQAKAYWHQHPQELARFQRENHLDSEPVVLFVSRLEPANRVDMLLNAVAQLAQKYPSLKAVVIGEGENKQQLQNLAESLGIEDRLHWLGAIYEESELAPWFLSATMFCYPANIGLSILHAFGYGLPVITSDRSQAQNPEIEALQPGVNGLTYTDGSSDDLARAIGDILDDPIRRQQMSDNALKTVTQTFYLDRMVDGMEAAIRYCHEESTPH